MDKKGLNYIVVTDSKTGEVVGFVGFIDGKVISADGFDVRIGYGEPEFIDRDGKVYMNLE